MGKSSYSILIIMQTQRKQEESFNLLTLQHTPQNSFFQKEAFRPGNQQAIESKEISETQIKSSKMYFSFALYSLILLLVCALLYHINFIFGHSTSDSQTAHLPTHFDTQQQDLIIRNEQQKRRQSLNEARIKELKLIELEREMIKLNKMIKSKSEYDQNLISTQLEKERKIKLKYWQLEQSIQSVQNKKKEFTDELYISSEVGQEELTHFPKIVWMYIEENITWESNLTQLLIANLAEYLQLQGYDFYLIGEYNFRYLMSNRHEEQLGYVLVDLWHTAYQTNTTTNLKDHTFTIKKQLISLIMLAELGGILIDREAILMEGLGWLEDFKQLALANHGRNEKPNIIGFYHVNYTGTIDEIEMNGFQKKKVHLYPPLDSYFLAVSRQGTAFISEVLQRYYGLIQYPERVEEILHKYELDLREITGKDPYYQAYFIAFSWVLKRKQMQLDIEWQKSGKQSLRPLAIDYYGVYAINRVYGPLKYRFLFSQQKNEDTYNFLSKMDYTDLSRQFGNASYLSFIPFQYHITEFIDKAEEGDQQYVIYRNSFLGKFVYKNWSESWIVDKQVMKQPFQLQYGVAWKSLPKKVWVFQRENSIVNKLCLSNLQQSATASNFQLIILTEYNLQKYLSPQIFNKIKLAHQNIALKSPNITLTNIWNELVKLAVISQQGGIWLDLPIFTLRDFEWILSIHENKQVINKVRRLPQVLMFYHGIESGFPYNCTKEHCFINDHLSFLTTLFAADRQSLLMRSWFNDVLQNLALNELKFKQKLLDFNITYNFITSSTQFLKITLQTILTARNYRYKNLQNSHQRALTDYGVWLLSSFTGLDKLKQYTNFDVGFNKNNAYLWQIPKTKLTELLGSFDYLIHLSQEQQHFLNKQLIHSTDFIHPNSLLAKELLNFTLLKELLASESQIAENNKTKHEKDVSFPKLVWVYMENPLNIRDEEKKWMENTNYYCSGYDVRIISSLDFQDFLTDQIDVEELLQEFVPYLITNEATRQQIREQLIFFAILYCNGGIFIAPYMFLTQHISFIDHIINNPFIIGSQGLNFAFYHKEKIGIQLYQTYLRQYFLASVKGSYLMADLLSFYTIIIKEAVANSHPIGSSTQLFYYTLEKLYAQAKDKDERKIQSRESEFEVFLQYYGVSAIDADYFPQKLVEFTSTQKTNLLARMNHNELEQYIGPLKYMIKFQRNDELFLNIKDKRTIESSFIAKSLHFAGERITYSPSFDLISGSSKWQDLPKIMWYYSNASSNSQTDQLNLIRVQKLCEHSEIVLIVIKQEKYNQYVEVDKAQAIESALKNQNIRVNAHIRHYLYTLAILIKHGGIYLSNNYIPTQQFDWLFNPLSHSLIYNKYSKIPSLLHFFSSKTYDFDYDARYEVKTGDTSEISLQFIATIQSNTFLQLLLSQTLLLITLDDDSLDSILNEYAVLGSSGELLEPQLLIKVAYRQIIDKKAKELKQGSEIDTKSDEDEYDARKFFNVWAFPQQIGPKKLAQLNVKEQYGAYCQTNGKIIDQVFGVPQFFIKLRNTAKTAIQDGSKCHQQSYFDRYLGEFSIKK